VLTQGYWYLEDFWHQFGNSLHVGPLTMLVTMLCMGRTPLRKTRILVNCALLTYVLPSSFLAIPFVRVVQSYGLGDSIWSVVAAEVMLATPFAILVLHQYRHRRWRRTSGRLVSEGWRRARQTLPYSYDIL